jgi:hypothetical protein
MWDCLFNADFNPLKVYSNHSFWHFNQNRTEPNRTGPAFCILHSAFCIHSTKFNNVSGKICFEYQICLPIRIAFRLPADFLNLESFFWTPLATFDIQSW